MCHVKYIALLTFCHYTLILFVHCMYPLEICKHLEGRWFVGFVYVIPQYLEKCLAFGNKCLLNE